MQNLNELDSYVYYARRGDSGKLKVLYDAFIKEGFVTFRILKTKYRIYSVANEEIEEFLTDLFLKVMRGYDHKKSKFSTYCKAVINKNLNFFLIHKLDKMQEEVLSLDLQDEDGTPLIEKVPSRDYEDLVKEISYKDTVYRIASKSKSRIALERQKSKIVLHRLCGYSKEEICKRLRISEGKYRYILKLIEDDKNYNELKFDLK